MKIDFNQLLHRNTKKLEQEKIKVEREIKHLEKSDKFQKENIELSEVEFESRAEDMEVQENNNFIKKNLTEYLHQIKTALGNIRKKKYGKCQRCGKQIPPERLAADPSAIYCVSCAELIENGAA